MEIRYQRPVTYSIDMDDKSQRQLAKHLGLTLKELRAMVDSRDILDNHYDAIAEWAAHNENLAEYDATADIEDLEID